MRCLNRSGPEASVEIEVEFQVHDRRTSTRTGHDPLPKGLLATDERKEVNPYKMINLRVRENLLGLTNARICRDTVALLSLGRNVEKELPEGDIVTPTVSDGCGAASKNVAVEYQ
ncbi:MAG: hypothetical protein ABI468_11915 [Candidatus Nanopelagicales bacterium]